MTSPIKQLTKEIEAKVIAAAGGSGVGAAFGTYVLWLLGVLIWHAPGDAAHAAAAVAAVPAPVSALTLLLLGIVGAALGGYLAPHTSRTPGAHSTDTATPLSVSPADLTSTPLGAEPVAASPLAGVPPSVTAADLLKVPAAEPAAAS